MEGALIADTLRRSNEDRTHMKGLVAVYSFVVSYANAPLFFSLRLVD
jgi:hypothetical protein